jgi:hypothetical protein
MIVESGIPMWFTPAASGRAFTYPFSRMKVGDSFEIGADLSLKSVRASASRYARLNGQRFAIWKVAPRSKTYRCWRIK